MHIIVPVATVPVLAQADVVVCGAGCSGVAAAVSAARHGCRVVLLERWPSVGGMATQALVNAGQFPDFNEGNMRGCLQWAADHSLWNVCPVAGNPLDEEELTRLGAAAREKVVAYLDFWRREMPGFAQAQIEQTGFALGVRESRRIAGRKTLDAAMVLGAVKQPDAIGHGVWMVDIHDPKGTGYTTYTDRGQSNMVPEGDSYHIPLGMCLNDCIPNLAVAGRCASSTHEAHASVRVQTHCMVMGQGVGTAAALALDAGCDRLSDVNVPALQETLRADGVYLESLPKG